MTGDTHPLGCAFDESIVYHKVLINFFTIITVLYSILINQPTEQPNSLCGCTRQFYSISRRTQISVILSITPSTEFTPKNAD